MCLYNVFFIIGTNGTKCHETSLDWLMFFCVRNKMQIMGNKTPVIFDNSNTSVCSIYTSYHFHNHLQWLCLSICEWYYICWDGSCSYLASRYTCTESVFIGANKYKAWRGPGHCFNLLSVLQTDLKDAGLGMHESLKKPGEPRTLTT